MIRVQVLIRISRSLRNFEGIIFSVHCGCYFSDFIQFWRSFILWSRIIDVIFMVPIFLSLIFYGGELETFQLGLLVMNFVFLVISIISIAFIFDWEYRLFFFYPLLLNFTVVCIYRTASITVSYIALSHPTPLHSSLYTTLYSPFHAER